MKRKTRRILFNVLDAIFFITPIVVLILFWEAGQTNVLIKILMIVLLSAQTLIILSTSFFKDRMYELEREENESLKRLLIEIQKEFKRGSVQDESREKDSEK